MKYKRFTPLLTVLLWFVFSLSAFAAKDEEVTETGGDNTPPTLQAYISGGFLTLTGFDESGIDAFFVNGYEYTGIVDNTISFRLQKFDASVQFFKIRAMDTAGNLSSVYKLLNPYYDDNPGDNDDKGLSTLPDDGSKADPSGAQALVLSHDKTDYYGNLIGGSVTSSGEEVIDGRDFYTIKADSGKIFYLVVDRRNGDEQVYFLTEVSENDLLNLTDEAARTLIKNSTSLDAGATTQTMTQTSQARWEDSAPVEKKEVTNKNVIQPNYKIFAILGIAGGVVILMYLLMKKKKEKQSDDNESDEDDDEDEEDE